MKKALLLILLISNVIISQVGIGTVNPDSSAALDITSQQGGLLVPRMTETQRDLISNPANGLLVYQTNNDIGYWYYKTSSWTYLSKEGDNDWEGLGTDNITEDIYTYGVVDIRAASGTAALTIGSNTTTATNDGTIAIGPYTAISNSSKFVIGKERIATAFDSIYVCGGLSCYWQVFATEFTNRNAFEITETGAVTINSRYTLPLGDGEIGDYITTDGNGNLSWQSPTTSMRTNENTYTIKSNLKTIKKLQNDIDVLSKQVKELKTLIIEKYYLREEENEN